MSKIDEYRSAVEKNPESAVAHLKLGTFLLIKKQDAKEAEKEIRKAIEIKPDYAKAWVNLGGLLLATWDFKGCVEANSKAISCDPDLVEAHYNCGLGHLYLKEAEEMVACFNKVLKLDPNNGGGHYHLAVGLLHLGKVKQAEVEATIAKTLGFAVRPEFIRELEKQTGNQGNLENPENSGGQPAIIELGSIDKDSKH
jgi:tetratricopeptide (TPR) repeat protein